MRLVRIHNDRGLNRSIQVFISSLCSFVLVIAMSRPGTLATIIQGDVGGWSAQQQEEEELVIPESVPRVGDIQTPPTKAPSTPNKPSNKIGGGGSKKAIDEKVGNRIATVAKRFADKKVMCSTRPESCARCVRAILKAAGCNYKVVSSNPLDGWRKPYGPLFANSLWGKDIGVVKGKKEKILPGDLVFFENTYRGKWWNKSGLVRKDIYNTGKQPFTPVVTHIEIAISDTQMVGKRSAFRPMSKTGIKTRFGSKYLGSVRMYAELCNPNP